MTTIAWPRVRQLAQRVRELEALLKEAYVEDSGLALWSEHPDAIREFRDEYQRDIYGTVPS